MHRVAALALPDVVAFDLSIPAQVFGHVDERGDYALEVCGARRGSVSSTTGFDLWVDHGLEALARADTVVVAGFMPTDDPTAEVLAALRDAHDRGARIASVCVGAFALGAAGLLDGRAATTHWDHASALAARFPEAEVRPEVLYVDEGSVLTSAGISAGVDLCLHMVSRDFGVEHASRVARRMVAPLHRSGGQAQFIERPLPQAGSSLATTCTWAVTQLNRSISVTEMAAHAGYAPRSFTRLFRDEIGTSPMRWLAAQRVREAQRMLEGTDLPIETIAAECGLGTAVTLRSHFARELATTPSAYRQAFRHALD